ncbi:hypothetical protein [Ralstonia pickettii]|uniref:hypothetical protein n=1 Tax=Ralstonia pickettii TaxID=329 RepID=UPI0015F9D51D|nr:hypothetical protein [Ralstonia pickettii]MBB0026838.1 hypothetical protein [Ralstonia pickettii]MBB0034664.1 hypothetical protein [Ralstonia pickettii]MBB0100001.1 hypothetical protein [Ralstonia pickettii]MBB0109960.1 hypothetical protein [Ralstonia pickettii]MBB0130940.1 hypothetical protein [Ralstonia pickettii]
MATIIVQFTDAKQTAITAYFGAPQDPDVYPNQAEIDTADKRYATFYNGQSAQFQAFLPSPG